MKRSFAVVTAILSTTVIYPASAQTELQKLADRALGRPAVTTAPNEAVTGSWYFTKDWQGKGPRAVAYQLRYTLELNRNGHYELSVERGSGEKPRFTDEELKANGVVLDRLDRKVRVSETGDWKQNRTKITLTATKFDGRDTDAVSRIDVRNGELGLTDYSQETYGTADFKFTRSARPAPAEAGNPISVPAKTPLPGVPINIGRTAVPDNAFNDIYSGNWMATQDIPGDGYKLSRLLQLTKDGRATLTTYYDGPHAMPVNRETVRNLGSLLAMMTNGNRFFSHAGTWRANGTNITINLDRVGADRHPQAISCLYGQRQLSVAQIDREEYGSKQFAFTRFYGVVNLPAPIGARDSGRNPITPNRGGSAPQINLPNPRDIIPRNDPPMNVIDQHALDTARFVGKWSANFAIPGDDGQLNRTLEFRSNGIAILVTDYSGKGKPFSSSKTFEAVGNITSRMGDRRKSLVHDGTWQFKGDEVTINLTMLGNEKYEDRFVFKLVGKSLKSESVNRDDYGHLEITLSRK